MLKTVISFRFFVHIVSILCLVLVCGHIGYAQPLLWANHTGANDDDESMGLTVDVDGNVISTGYFYGAVDFDPGAGIFSLTAVGFCDVYIQKLDANGDFIWAKSLTGGAYEFDQGRSVATDSSGNVYVTGVFGGEVDFDPGIGVDLHTAVDNEDIFILKLSAEGEFQWAQTFGSTAYDAGNGIDVDDNGDVIVTGSFWNTIDFDASAGVANLDNIGAQDAFVMKLTQDGELVMAKNFGGLADDVGMAVHHDINNNIILSGSFSKDADFDPDTTVFTLFSEGMFDVFALKLDPAGNFMWANAMGGSGMDFSRSVVADTDGSVYVIGEFLNAANFVSADTMFSITSNGDHDMFIAKLNSVGDVKWGYGIGGIFDDAPTDVAADGKGNVYVTGYFRQTVDFDPGADTVLVVCPGVYDAFVLRLNAQGAFKDVMHFGGTKLTMANDIALDEMLNMYVGGLFDYAADFDPDSSTYTLNSFGSYDAFIAKYANCITEVVDMPTDQLVFAGTDAVFHVTAVPDEVVYQWQVDTGAGFEPIYDGAMYTGVHNDTLIVHAPELIDDNTAFRCIVEALACADTSDFATLYVEEPVGVDNTQQHQNLVTVFPNPVQSILTIQFASVDDATMLIRSAIGQIVYTPVAITDQLQVNISDWPSGVYFVEVITEDLNYVKQVVLE